MLAAKYPGSFQGFISPSSLLPGEGLLEVSPERSVFSSHLDDAEMSDLATLIGDSAVDEAGALVFPTRLAPDDTIDILSSLVRRIHVRERGGEMTEYRLDDRITRTRVRPYSPVAVDLNPVVGEFNSDRFDILAFDLRRNLTRFMPLFEIAPTGIVTSEASHLMLRAHLGGPEVGRLYIVVNTTASEVEALGFAASLPGLDLRREVETGYLKHRLCVAEARDYSQARPHLSKPAILGWIEKRHFALTGRHISLIDKRHVVMHETAIAPGLEPRYGRIHKALYGIEAAQMIGVFDASRGCVDAIRRDLPAILSAMQNAAMPAQRYDYSVVVDLMFGKKNSAPILETEAWPDA